MASLPTIDPIKLKRRPHPFNKQGWLFELKYDGFRAVAYLNRGHCKLVSRNSFTFTRFRNLARDIASELTASAAILDGEIVVLDAQGVPQFDDLIAGRGKPVYAAFDLLWLDGTDLRCQPLQDRKRLLKKVIKQAAQSVLFVNHIEERGTDLFQHACVLDLEGIVAKSSSATYSAMTTWYKIKNRNYTQSRGRAARFNARRR